VTAFDPLLPESFRPIADTSILEHHHRMTEAYRTVAVRQRITKAGALVVLLGFVIAISYLEFSTVVPKGRIVKAEVLRLGTRPVARVAGGDLPIITVRLPDGSVREVQATWADVNNCEAGRFISLVQQGTALQVGRPGCNNAD